MGKDVKHEVENRSELMAVDLMVDSTRFYAKFQDLMRGADISKFREDLWKLTMGRMRVYQSEERFYEWNNTRYWEQVGADQLAEMLGVTDKREVKKVAAVFNNGLIGGVEDIELERGRKAKRVPIEAAHIHMLVCQGVKSGTISTEDIAEGRLGKLGNGFVIKVALASGVTKLPEGVK